MDRLVDENGKISFGLFNEPVDRINYVDYPLRTPMGRQRPSFLKRLLFNQFVFIGVIAPEVVAGAAIIDLNYLSSAFVYVYDRRTGLLHEIEKIGPPIPWKRFIAPTPEDVAARFESGPLTISIEQGQLRVRSAEMAVDLQLQPLHRKPLRLCTRAGYTGWVYTQKTTPIGVSGEIRAGGRTTTVAPPAAMAMMDWTAGYMRRETFWNWAATAAVLPDGRTFGLNLACGVNETGFTENAFWVDGELTRVDPVCFDFDLHRPDLPWRIRSGDGRIDLEFHPETKRSQNVNGGVIATRFTQFIGSFTGTAKPVTGDPIEIAGCIGWAEDHYAKW